MPLSSEQQAAIIRLFGDEGLVDMLAGICQDTADAYKDRAFKAASSSEPNLVEIVQEANRGYAFENIMTILRSEFKKITTEEEDAGKD